MTRTEHLAWCKKRAHEYLERGDIKNAVASMMSDLEKHEETKGVNHFVGALGLMAARDNDRAAAARFIDGFR